MCRLGKLILYVLLAVLPQVVLCLKDVVLDIEPRVVKRGEISTLSCSYNLEDNPLYSVKWYRGQFEFYRYTPKEHPSTKIFPRPGIHVDLKESNEHQVVLRDVGFNLSGKFTCEVTADAPLFSTVAVSKDMLVVVLPSDSPALDTDKNVYEVNDRLRANCSTRPSRPAATLTFVLNNVVVGEGRVTRKNPVQELWYSDLTLDLNLTSSHFSNGRIALKCLARIGDLYQQDTEVILPNVKDPVPQRVTQTSAACCYCQTRIFSIGFIVVTLVFTSRRFC